MSASPPDHPPLAPLCIAGLGNPGGTYAATRHNIGFHVITRLANALGAREPVLVSGRRETALSRGGRSIVLCMPWTYMNRSGEALAAIAGERALAPDAFLVVYDDAALPLGMLRIRAGGSDGGHMGMRSIIAALGSGAIPRVRCGIGPPPPGCDMATWVLSPFLPAERAIASALADRAVEAILHVLDEGLERAMSRYNALPPAVAGGNEYAGPSPDPHGDAAGVMPLPARGGLFRILRAMFGRKRRRDPF